MSGGCSQAILEGEVLTLLLAPTRRQRFMESTWSLSNPKCKSACLDRDRNVLIPLHRIPQNCGFARQDIEEEWTNIDNNFWDLIHMRMLNGAITSWPDTYNRIFRCANSFMRVYAVTNFGVGI